MNPQEQEVCGVCGRPGRADGMMRQKGPGGVYYHQGCQPPRCVVCRTELRKAGDAWQCPVKHARPEKE